MNKLDTAEFEQLETKARAGDAAAQFEFGRHIAQDKDNSDIAGYWLEQAAEQGHAEAQYQLGLLYAEGKVSDDSLSRVAQKLLLKVDQDKQSHGDIDEPLAQSTDSPQDVAGTAQEDKKMAVEQLLAALPKANPANWVVRVIMVLVAQEGLLKYLQSAANGNATGEAPDSLFFDFDALRFYYACKVALEKPGDPVANFTRLDPLRDEALEKAFGPFIMQSVVAWFDAKRHSSADCDAQAEVCKRRIAEDWTYFD